MTEEREWTLEGRGEWPGTSQAREGELVDPPKDARTILAFWIKPSPVLSPDEKVVVVPKSRAEAAEQRVAELERMVEYWKEARQRQEDQAMRNFSRLRA